MNLSRFALVLLAAAASRPLAVAAQAPTRPPASSDTTPREPLASEPHRRVTALLARPGVIQMNGDVSIPVDSVVRGELVVVEGDLRLAGRVTGGVLVLNGSVELLPRARIGGDLTVTGGAVTGLEAADVYGEIIAYAEEVSVRRDGDQLVVLEPEQRSRRSRAAEGIEKARNGARRRRADHGGRSDFLFASSQSYNRVEGLPITFGPVIETEGRNPFRARALAIYRTESGTLDRDELGYFLRGEQLFGGRGLLRAGATLHRVIDPIEGWHLSDLENGLATFLFHQDFRDHYEREGWSAFAGVGSLESGRELLLEYRDENHRSKAAGDPWSLSGGRWRPQPLVGEGRLRTLGLSGTLDTRSDRENPASGWYLNARVERSLNADLQRPSVLGGSALAEQLAQDATFGDFSTAFVDVRRYNRVSPEGRLNLRVVAGGSLDGSALPPQRQHALGGEGSLPGYGLFSLDCGARSARVVRTSDAAAGKNREFFPRYGCDRIAMLQAEYRGTLSFRFDVDSDWDDDGDEENAWTWDGAPKWAVFVDAGRGYSLRGGGDEALAIDAGLGLIFSRLGVYLAAPLVEEGGLNLFVRLGPRF